MTARTAKRTQNPTDANIPAMPRLAEKAGDDLARPLKATSDGLRAIEAWFRHHGDPFLPLEPLAFIADLTRHQDTCDALTTAELVARLWSAFDALNARLRGAVREH